MTPSFITVLLTCVTFIIHATASTETNQTNKSSDSREIYSREFQRYYTAANDVSSVKVTTVEAYSALHCISLCMMNQNTCQASTFEKKLAVSRFGSCNLCQNKPEIHNTADDTGPDSVQVYIGGEWDECSRGVADCGINAVCIDTPDSYNCSCAAGYQGDGYTCEDKNECLVQEDDCESYSSCYNTIGSFYCRCYNGFNGTEDSHHCTDIDECALGLHNCNLTETNCTNRLGSYNCDCPLPGYHSYVPAGGTHRICMESDECARGTDNCHFHAICEDTFGSFTCSCRDGYTGDGLTCTGPCDSYYHYNPISNSCMRPVQSTRDWIYARDTYCHGSYRTKMITFSSDESLHWFEEWLNDEESPLPSYWTTRTFWIGLKRVGTTYSWDGMFTNGTMPDSTWWASDTPIADEEACVYYSAVDRLLHEKPCDYHGMWFFCEKESNV